MIKSLIAALLIFVSSSAAAWDLDLAAGYNMLQITNPDGSNAYSDGFVGGIGAHWALVDRENFRFGLKGSVDYSDMKNDVNTAINKEQTRLFTAGAGFEMRVHHFFIGVQYRYNRPEIKLSGTQSASSRYSFYSPYLEVGYELEMSRSAVRFYYRRTDTEISQTDTGFSAASEFKNSGIFVGLRFHLGAPKVVSPYPSYEASSNGLSDYTPPERTDNSSTFYSTPSVDTSRRNSFRPRPSGRLSY